MSSKMQNLTQSERAQSWLSDKEKRAKIKGDENRDQRERNK